MRSPSRPVGRPSRTKTQRAPKPSASRASPPRVRPAPSAPLECAAGPDTIVRLGYVVHDEEGTSVERGRSQVVLGYGQLLPGVESALTGARAGARLTVELPPEQAYGARDPQAILEIERGELPPDVQPGDQLEAEHAEGGVVVLTVLEVAQDAVRVDTNHPLAGQKVRFELEVESVRPATDEELDRAAEQVERALRSPGPSGSENAGLIPTQRLLDRPPRR